LKKTCRRSGISFWHYLLDHLSGTNNMPQLSDFVRRRAQEVKREGAKRLNDTGGIELMRKAQSEVEGHIPYPGMSEYWWSGIGSWEA
jgi:hypothetical protein